MSRGISDYRVRLDATRIAHQARSWNELVSLVRRQVSSHGIGGPEDAKLLIDTATAAYGAEHGDGEGAWYYRLTLQKEYDDQRAAASRQRIDIRTRQLEADPNLRAQLERQDRIQKLADETGVEFEFAAEFMREFDQLSWQDRMKQFPGVIHPEGLKFIQVEAPLYGSAYLIKNWILPFTPAGPLLFAYEGHTGKDLLTGEPLATWERVLTIVASLLPFVGGAVKGGAKAVASGVKAVAAQLSRGAKAMAGLAIELRTGARNMLRFVARLARIPADKLQALLERVGVVRRASQGFRPAADELRLAGQVDAAVKELEVLEAGARAGSRTASGLIEDGRAISRTQSGTLKPKPTPTPKPGAAAGAGAAKALSKAAQSLVDAGYLPQAIAALEGLGVKVTGKVAERLKALGTTGSDFLNLFHRSKGFQRVVADFVRGGNKQIGAEFVMRFATSHPDILKKVTVDPLLVAFEWGVGIRKTRFFGDIFSRQIDIVVRGNAILGEAGTIFHELKSWTEITLRAASQGKKLPLQLVKDTAQLNPQNILWVFNGAKITDKREIIKVFVKIIEEDAYLTKAWGTDRDAIIAALNRVVSVF